MSKFPNRVKVATAITSRSRQDLSCQHITTGNFMDYMVSKRMRLVPNQSIKVSHRLFSRVDPLEVPTYGNSTIRTRVFWVPYRTVMPAWNDFIEDAVHNYTNGSPSLVPYAHRIKNSTIVNFLTRTTDTVEHPATAEVATNLDTCDIVVIGTNGQPVGYNLTPYGSRALRLFQQCGYAINFNLVGMNDAASSETYHSALPLLCIAKVYYDWYYQNQYINDEWAMSLESLFNYDNTWDFAEYVNSNGSLDHIMRVITKVNYDSDYFVSAWDNPVGPTAGSMSQTTFKDITSSNNTVISGYDSLKQTPILQSTTTGSTPRVELSQFSLDALKAFNDFCKRKQIAGARVFDRYLAEFGITLEAEMLKRSVYLTDYIQEVNVGDVTSTADTITETYDETNDETSVRGSQLGSYAGKAISVGDFNSFSFDAVEYGELVVISTIIPRTAYFQGQDKTTMSQTRMDFWLPEFDSLGVQSLDTREVFVPMDSREQYPEGTTTYTKLNYNNYVFGFVPRYAEYKKGVDMITGDFRLRSRDAGKDSWTLFRDLTLLFKARGIAETKHDRIFTTGADSSQYNRLFYITEDGYDHFKIEHTFNIESSFPGKSLYDDYEFNDEDKAKKVAVDLQGVKAN